MAFTRLSLFLGLLSFLVLIPTTLQGKACDYDPVIAERQIQSLKNCNESYHPNPEEVTMHLNEHVARTLIGLVFKRRLAEAVGAPPPGECKATNPIDECWRCDPEWDKNRKKMADCALGFGRGTTGGKAGEIYVVKDNTDDPENPVEGTLRWGAVQKQPLWITFEKDMIINLKQELIVQNDKTIDGRGANVEIADGPSLNIEFTKNIIVSNIKIHGTVGGPGGKICDEPGHIANKGKCDGDAIRIFGGSNIWIDHCTLSKGVDGLIDVTHGSTAITVSNCHFSDHNKVILFGADDQDAALDAKMQATVAFNHFGKGCGQRMPRGRAGFFHVVNNDHTYWDIYALGGGAACTIISQGNRYANPGSAKEATKRDCQSEEWKNWDWVSEGDVFENGCFFTPSGNPAAAKKFAGEQMLAFQPGAMAPEMTKNAGALTCTIGKPC